MWPGFACETDVALPAELVRSVCTPYFEDINCSMQQMPTGLIISREVLRAKCEPFFERMIDALQHQVQDSQKDAGACFPSSFYPRTSVRELDEVSTDADESCAFASIFSVPSEGEGLDSVESMSDTVPSPIAVEKSTMVCRHWKSKGWCRLESNCKFLHSEHKRGVSAPSSCNNTSTNDGNSGAECTVPLAPAGGRRKKANKKSSTKELTAQLGQGDQSFEAQPCCLHTMYFPNLSPAPGIWLEAGAR